MPSDVPRPSPEAEAVLRWAGWTPERQIDPTDWIQRLQADGNTVFPLAEAILRSYGGIRLDDDLDGGRSNHDLEVDPTLWWDERESVEFIEEVAGARVCPVGEASGGAMLAVTEDGRVLLEFEGSVILLGENWRAGLDNLILGQGEDVLLAEDNVRLDPPR